MSTDETMEVISICVALEVISTDIALTEINTDKVLDIVFKVSVSAVRRACEY